MGENSLETKDFLADSRYDSYTEKKSIKILLVWKNVKYEKM